MYCLLSFSYRKQEFCLKHQGSARFGEGQLSLMISSRGIVLRAGGRQLTRVLVGSRPTDQTPDLYNRVSGVHNKASGPSDSTLSDTVATVVRDFKAMYPTLEKVSFAFNLL